MESATQNTIEEESKILVAASWKSTSENDFGVDGMYKSFRQVMEYRKALAKRFLQIPDGASDKEYIREMLDDCNEKLKQILGL